MKYRDPILAALLFAAAATGIWLLRQSGDEHRRADRNLIDASSRAVSRLRELDKLEFQIAQGGESKARAETTLAQWVDRNTGAEERKVVQDILDCLHSTPCTAGVGQPLAEGRIYFSSLLDGEWGRNKQAHAVAAQSGDWGMGLCLLGALLGVMGLVVPRRHAVPGPPSSRIAGDAPVSGDAPDAGQSDQLKAALEQRTAQLFSVQLKAWETDRFAAFGEIAAGLSHGLKTPLASIRATAQLAQAKLDDGHPAVEQLDEIIDEIDLLVEQIKRFLAATGTGAPQPVEVAPAQIVAVLDQEYSAAAAERGIRWQASCAEELPRFTVDPGLVTMALRNIVENALAATPRGGTVAIRAGSCEAPAKVGIGQSNPGPGAWLEIAVEDEGPGLPDEVMSAPVAVRSTKPGGSGLGLAIARRIVARHGGALVSTAGANGGTLIRAVLPVQRSEGDEEAGGPGDLL